VIPKSDIICVIVRPNSVCVVVPKKPAFVKSPARSVCGPGPRSLGSGKPFVPILSSPCSDFNLPSAVTKTFVKK
jgi:hypothetical protein